VYKNQNDVRVALTDIAAAYVKSLDEKTIDENTRKQLLRIHEDYYKIIDVSIRNLTCCALKVVE
jgi:hypothetical protein